LKFLLSTPVHPLRTIYIKAVMTDSNSVVIAEAVALALAAIVTDRMNFNHTNFLLDNQQLVQFLNTSDQSNPPDS